MSLETLLNEMAYIIGMMAEGPDKDAMLSLHHRYWSQLPHGEPLDFVEDV